MPGPKVSILKRGLHVSFPVTCLTGKWNPSKYDRKTVKDVWLRWRQDSAVQTPGASRTVQLFGLVIEFPLPDGWVDLEFFSSLWEQILLRTINVPHLTMTFYCYLVFIDYYWFTEFFVCVWWHLPRHCFKWDVDVWYFIKKLVSAGCEHQCGQTHGCGGTHGHCCWKWDDCSVWI